MIITGCYCSCFSDNLLVLLASLLGPVFLLLLFLLLALVVSACVVIRYSTKSFRNTEKASKRRGATLSMLSVLGVVLIFLLTWSAGALAVRDGSTLFQYVFAGLLCLQGFFVFFFYVVLARETRDVWLQACGCKKRKKRKTYISAITTTIVPKSERAKLDKNADRLRAMEEIDVEGRLAMNSWDISFIMPPQNQFDIVLSSEDTKSSDALLEGTGRRPSREAETHLPAAASVGSEEGSQLGPLKQPPSLEDSPTHSLDSTAQNAMECLSTADSGIHIAKSTSPVPTQDWQHPQSGSTPHHVHSVSGIGYVSAESSMETLPLKEEDCYRAVSGKSESIILASTLRPRAIPNEYATVHVEALT